MFIPCDEAFSFNVPSLSKSIISKNVALRGYQCFTNTRVYHIPAKEVLGLYRNHPVCLSVCLSVCSSVCLSRVNLTLALTFEPKETRLTYNIMWVPFDKTFLSVSKLLTLTFDLLLKKNLTLAITFEPEEIGLSYHRHVFLVRRPFFLPPQTEFFLYFRSISQCCLSLVVFTYLGKDSFA